MKNLPIVILFVACFFALSSCSEKTVPMNKKEELKQPEIGDDLPSGVANEIFDKAPITTTNVPELQDQEGDCHGKRMISQTIENGEGAILKISGKFVISTDNGNTRYNPCELPKRLRADGIKVRFSGDVLEIFSGERLFATPFSLRNIVERD